MSRASNDTTEDVPIIERIYAHEMTQEFESLLLADANTDWSFERDDYEVVQDLPTEALWTGLLEREWGQTMPDWIEFLQDFKSAPHLHQGTQPLPRLP
jgi:hypothetical protein